MATAESRRGHGTLIFRFDKALDSLTGQDHAQVAMAALGTDSYTSAPSFFT